MSSKLQAGWSTSPRGPNSTMYGFTSSTGVPSIASRPRTSITPPGRTAISSHTVVPMRLGRFLARWARMPTFGQSGLPRGCRLPRVTVSGSTRSNTYSTSTWENARSPSVASAPSRSRSSSIRLFTRSQSSSIASLRSLRTTPIGSMPIVAPPVVVVSVVVASSVVTVRVSHGCRLARRTDSVCPSGGSNRRPASSPAVRRTFPRSRWRIITHP